jgi:plasmid maintenance system antidote protein VapI
MHASSYDIRLMRDDIEDRGWQPIDLARAARVSHSSVYRFLDGDYQTPPMALKFATALGRPLSRYLRKSRKRKSRKLVRVAVSA